jgi:hypothetical protein
MNHVHQRQAWAEKAGLDRWSFNEQPPRRPSSMVPWNWDHGPSKHPLIVDQPWGLLYGRDAATGATLGIVLPVGSQDPVK